MNPRVFWNRLSEGKKATIEGVIIAIVYLIAAYMEGCEGV